MTRNARSTPGVDVRANPLERAVAVLMCFRPSGGVLTLAELVRRTGLPKPTVHRLASQLVELGLLQRATPGYLLGVALFELGELVPLKRSLREEALPFMQDLYEATHETVHLGIRDGHDVVYAEKIQGHAAVKVPSRVGGRLPLNCTGVGKALLAFADADMAAAFLAEPLRRLTPHSINDPAKLRVELAEIRASGISYDRREAASGVDCVASPVIVHGRAVAALSVAVPAQSTRSSALAFAVRGASLALSRQLQRAGHVSYQLP
jgi:DNA-binding IclR family transcriptional regulator